MTLWLMFTNKEFPLVSFKEGGGGMWGLGVAAKELHRNPCCFTADFVKTPPAQQPHNLYNR